MSPVSIFVGALLIEISVAAVTVTVAMPCVVFPDASATSYVKVTSPRKPFVGVTVTSPSTSASVASGSELAPTATTVSSAGSLSASVSFAAGSNVIGTSSNVTIVSGTDTGAASSSVTVPTAAVGSIVTDGLFVPVSATLSAASPSAISSFAASTESTPTPSVKVTPVAVAGAPFTA